MNEENRKYQEFIKRYFAEEGITYSSWKEIQPLYLRYRGRCLKMKPESYEQFLNLCLFESNRRCKYDSGGKLKEGETAGWDKSEDEKEQERDYAGVYYTGKQARMNYKLSYKESPKKEDFEHPMEWRAAYHDWSYLKEELSDYEAVKARLNKPANKKKPDLIPNENSDGKHYHYMFQLPFLVRYALRCLSGEYPPECFPEALNDYRDELQSLLDKQREAYNQEPVNFVWDTNWNV